MFSLEAAQKRSKASNNNKKKKKEEEESAPADGSLSKKKKKSGEKTGRGEQQAEIPVIASSPPENMVLEGKERTLARNRCTSQAYHKEFDKHKPKKAMLQENPKQYEKMMEKAKAKARTAHKEAGTRFDAEHPKATKEEKKKSDKTTTTTPHDGGRDAEEEQADEGADDGIEDVE